MDMLHYLDVAIGFTLAMMVLATLIGTTTAAWLAAIQSKVRNLQNGLQQVLSALGDALTEEERLSVAKQILRGKMTAGWLGSSATEAVGREEFVILLLRAGTTAPGSKLGAAIQAITGQPPEATLRAVEKAILDQEAATPSAPANVWRTRALKEAAPALAARLFSPFDDVLARADDNTAYSRKLVSALLALAFLIIYPVNSFDVLSRLINDKALAAAIAKIADAETSKAGAASTLNPAATGNDKAGPPSIPKPTAAEPDNAGTASTLNSAPTGNDKTDPPSIPKPTAAEPDNAGTASTTKPAPAETGTEALRKAIDKQGLFGDVFSDTGAHRKLMNAAYEKDGRSGAAEIAVRESLSEPGVWTTFILVSLGAPFWQGLLDKLLGLRSKITAKTEEERAQRAAQNSTIA